MKKHDVLSYTYSPGGTFSVEKDAEPPPETDGPKHFESPFTEQDGQYRVARIDGKKIIIERNPHDVL